MEELIEKAKLKDQEAFTELILLIQKDLYKIARIRLDLNDACDAMQETMITAYENLNKLKDNKYFKTWVIKILINKCNKIYKKKKNLISFENHDIDNMIYIEDRNDKLDFDTVIRCLSR